MSMTAKRKWLLDSAIFLVMIVFGLLLLPIHSGAVLKGWERYQLITLEEIMDSYRGGILSENLAPLSSYIPASRPFRIEVTYGDKFRKIPEKRKEFIQDWSKTMDRKMDIPSLYKQEVLVTTEHYSQWMPIQEALVPFIKNECNKGDIVTVYISFIGAVRPTLENDTIHWLFLINEFETK